MSLPKNWRTTLTGVLAALSTVLTVLSALPATLGSVAETIPEPQKVLVFKCSLFATVALRILNSIWQADSKNVPAPFSATMIQSDGGGVVIVPPSTPITQPPAKP